jgi:hypothetical protein
LTDGANTNSVQAQQVHAEALVVLAHLHMARRYSADGIEYDRPDVLDPFFKPYPGFAATECTSVTTAQPDQIWDTVRWGDSELWSLWNKPVRLVFHLHQAGLYAFQFISLH